MRHPLGRATALLFGLVLIIAACGGGDSDDTASPSDTNGDVSTGAEDSPEDGTGQDADDETTAGDIDGEIPTGPSEPTKVTYEITDVEDQSDMESLTMSWDPPRFAMIFPDGKLVQTGEETLFCSPDDGCFRMGSAEEGLGALMSGGLPGFAMALEGADSIPGASASGSAEIAGRDARCMTYDAGVVDPSETGTAEFCYDSGSGVMLRWTLSDDTGEVQRLEATEVGEPDDSDFEATGPVQDMPGVGGTGG